MSAAVADIDMAAEGFCPAIDEVPDGAPVAVRDGRTEPIQIGAAVAAQYVCHFEHRPAVRGLQAGHEVVDRLVHPLHRG